MSYTGRILMTAVKRLRRGDRIAGSRAMAYLETSRLVAILIFLVTVGSIVAICYEGIGTANLPVLPGQISTVSVHASLPFSYVSQEQTRLQRERVRHRVPPVYRQEMTQFLRFETRMNQLLEDLRAHELSFPKGSPRIDDRRQSLTSIVNEFNAAGPYRVHYDDVDLLLSSGDAEHRRVVVERSLVVLREIYNEGTLDPSLSPPPGAAPGELTLYQVTKDNGEIVKRPVQSLEDAMLFLRVNLSAEGMPRDFSLALFRLFRNGLVPNLVFDPEATERRENEELKNLQPVSVSIERGQLLVEQGMRVTAEQYEMLLAHRQVLAERGETARDEGMQLLGRILLVLAMVAACAMYINIEDPETIQRNGRLTLLALVVIVNLAIVRITYALLTLDFFVQNPSWAAALPYLAPIALAPLIVAILIDTGSAIFVALFISLFTGIIYGNRVDVQVVTFLAAIVAVHSCRSLRSRSRVVRAALSSGAVVAGTTLLLGLAGQTPTEALVIQLAAGLITGLLTGVAVVGTLPLLEMLFHRTTDITLLELTDFNHPLLRQMQMEAPGTYHHSLVVAQLAENAAAAVGAHSLLTRVCALYHDIGKLRNPLYFSENQQEGRNPHDQLAPEESAEIIRRHIEDGLELAEKHHLPRSVRDSIAQHHGTSLIRYFYLRAREKAQNQEMNEEPFRYSGPKPNSREIALISLADSVEAAARSLRPPTQENITNLIDTLVNERIADGQLDEAPLTLEQINKARESFAFTLLSMLHSRVAYPKAP